MLARTVMCFLLMGTRMFQQAMRSVISPLLVFMAADLEVSVAQKGSLLSAIAFGYFFTQVPGGVLADRLGAKNVLAGALSLSALCCLAVPTAVDYYGLSGLWWCIAIMGAVQGPLFPTSTVFLSRWMPRSSDGGDEKAWGTSMLDIGISVGSLLIIPLANTLAEAFGWRQTYRLVGLASLCFVVLWYLLAADTPQECKFISGEEQAYLEKHLSQPKQVSKSKSGGVLGLPLAVALHPGLWALFGAHIAFNSGAYFITNWSPTYYADVLKVAPADTRLHLMLPHLTNLAVKAVTPVLVAKVDASGISLRNCRRLFTISGFLFSAACLLPVFAMRGASPWATTVLLSLTNAGFGLAPVGFKSNYLDVTEAYVGIVSGYGNTLGSLASWASPQLVAMLLESYTWQMVLFFVAATNLLAAANYFVNVTVEPIERPLTKRG